MRTLMAALVLGCFFSLAGLAVAGPFGTEMGQTPEQFKNLQKIERPTPREDVYTIYSTTVMPKTNDTFSNYTLLFGKNGLAKVLASSSSYTNDRYGTKAREEYEKVKKQLTKKYGEPKSYDFLKDGSIWDKDNEFAIAIWKEDRVLASGWVNNLPDNLNNILLKVGVGRAPGDTQLTLGYEYNNFRAIMEEADKKSEDAL